jgi:hypothetical protein
MSRNYRSDTSSHLVPASPNQLTEIKILIKRNEALTRQFLIPFATLATALLPHLMSRIIIPGGIFHELYTSILAMINPKEFNAHFGNYSELSSSHLTTHQQTAITILKEFEESLLNKLMVTRIFSSPESYSKISLNVSSALRMEAEILETQELFAPNAIPPLKATITVSEKDKQKMKQLFIEQICMLNIQAHSPVIPEAQLLVQSAVKEVNKAHRHIQFNMPTEWLTKNFFELAELLSESYYNLVNEASIPELSQISRLTVLEMIMGKDKTSWHLIFLSIFFSYLANNFIIYPAFKRIYQKRDGSQQIIARTQKYMSAKDAKEIIKQLSARNTTEEQKISMIYMGLGIFFPLLALVMAVYDYRESDRISAPLFVSGLCALGASLHDGYGAMMSHREKKNLARKIKRILENLNNAVACTKQKWQVNTGRWLSESYFTYESKKYGHLSNATVNETVKDILSSYGAHILSVGKKMHQIAPLFLDEDQVADINEQIEDHLNRLISIAQLKQQIEKYFYRSDIFEIRKMRDNLPIAEFVINCSEIINFEIEKIERLFPKCDLEYKNPYLIIIGSTPTRDGSVFKAVKLSYQKQEIEKKRESKDAFSDEEKEESPSEKIKMQSDLPDFSRHIDDEDDKTILIKWSATLIYNSGQKFCPIQPIAHPIYGKTNFVVFSIPERCFPTGSDYNFYKKKIESGRLAKRGKDSQGLQFRYLKKVVDQTVPGNRTFSSDVRAKFLGKRGDVRLFAEALQIKQDGQEYTLHNFKSVVFHAH